MATDVAPAGVSLRAQLRRSPSLRVIGKRLLQAIPVIWGTTFLTFCLLNLLPGDAAQALLGDNATAADVAALQHRLHLDQPFFVRYFDWLGNAVTGNLGTSLASSQPVAQILGPKIMVSIELVLLAFVLALVAAVPMGVLAAKKPGGIADRLSVSVSMFGLSVPLFVFALVLVLVFAVKLKVLPAVGFVPFEQSPVQNLRSLVLPTCALALPMFCVFNRLLRADIVDQLEGEDYITTARAKGVHPWLVVIRHALRNSVFGLLTVVGLQLGTLVGSTVVVEQIFGLPGLGQELLFAISNQDVPAVEGVVFVVACFVVLANLVTDLLYAVTDPRIRHDRSAS